jgi:hypothetical protein
LKEHGHCQVSIRTRSNCTLKERDDRAVGSVQPLAEHCDVIAPCVPDQVDKKSTLATGEYIISWSRANAIQTALSRGGLDGFRACRGIGAGQRKKWLFSDFCACCRDICDSLSSASGLLKLQTVHLNSPATGIVRQTGQTLSLRCDNSQCAF